MKVRIIALAAVVLVVAALGLAVAGSASAAEGEQDSWWQDMWEWCHGEGWGGPGAGGGAFLDWGTANAVSKALGIDSDELRSQMNSGKSVFDIAEAKGVSKDKLVDSVLAPYRDTLAVQVKYGYITQEQADQLVKQRTDWLNQRFAQTPSSSSGTRPQSFRGPGGFGGMMGGFGGMMGRLW